MINSHPTSTQLFGIQVIVLLTPPTYTFKVLSSLILMDLQQNEYMDHIQQTQSKTIKPHIINYLKRIFQWHFINISIQLTDHLRCNKKEVHGTIERWSVNGVILETIQQQHLLNLIFRV